MARPLFCSHLSTNNGVLQLVHNTEQWTGSPKCASTCHQATGGWTARGIPYSVTCACQHSITSLSHSTSICFLHRRWERWLPLLWVVSCSVISWPWTSPCKLILRLYAKPDYLRKGREIWVQLWTPYLQLVKHFISTTDKLLYNPNHNWVECVCSDLVRRHAGVLGLSACILSSPYDVPTWMPQLLMDLSVHLNDTQPIEVD